MFHPPSTKSYYKLAIDTIDAICNPYGDVPYGDVPSKTAKTKVKALIQKCKDFIDSHPNETIFLLASLIKNDVLGGCWKGIKEIFEYAKSRGIHMDALFSDSTGYTTTLGLVAIRAMADLSLRGGLEEDNVLAWLVDNNVQNLNERITYQHISYLLNPYEQAAYFVDDASRDPESMGIYYILNRLGYKPEFDRNNFPLLNKNLNNNKHWNEYMIAYQK